MKYIMVFILGLLTGVVHAGCEERPATQEEILEEAWLLAPSEGGKDQ